MRGNYLEWKMGDVLDEYFEIKKFKIYFIQWKKNYTGLVQSKQGWGVGLKTQF